MYYVYILHIKKTGRYYTGQTQSLAKRLQKHTRGETKSIKNRGEVKLVYVERYSTRAEAMKREKQIKSFKGGVAFKRLLANTDRKKKTNFELAEVLPLAG